jgi:citrate synthase
MSEPTGTSYPTYRTGIGSSTADTIQLLGHDLAKELIGQVGFGELAFWLIARRRPTPAEQAMFEAVLVSLADHGFTPTAIAARLTYTSAPESLQGAVAAGLLGGGSRFLGVTEDTARFLAELLAQHPVRRGGAGGPDELAGSTGQAVPDDAGWDALATEAVTAQREAGRFVPGLGHPVHKVEDPRTPVLFELARQHGTFGDHLQLFAAIGRVHPAILGRTLPLNGAGVCGAVLADLDLPVAVIRGCALLARCAGLLGHLVEEQTDPIGMDIYLGVDRHTDYQPPGS